MSKVSIAYRFAEHIHGSFFGSNGNLSLEEIDQSGIHADLTPGYKAERVDAYAGPDKELIYQHFSRSRITGYFTLSSVFRNEATQFTRITPTAPDVIVPILTESLFMHALVTIAEARPQD